MLYWYNYEWSLKSLWMNIATEMYLEKIYRGLVVNGAFLQHTLTCMDLHSTSPETFCFQSCLLLMIKLTKL